MAKVTIELEDEEDQGRVRITGYSTNKNNDMTPAEHLAASIAKYIREKHQGVTPDPLEDN